MATVSLLYAATLLSLTCILYGISLAIYRLIFHPLAKFPGPRPAALSRWYEFYYEAILRGQFTFHTQDLHKTYGPIVRITPDELHIQDSAFYDELYVKAGRGDKYGWMSGRFGNEHSVFTSAPDSLHRIRRSALNPFFSKKKIAGFQPVIREKVEKLCSKITQLDGKVFTISQAWMALTGDVVMQFAFGTSYDQLDVPGFIETFHEPFMAVSQLSHLTLQFPIMHPLLKSLPDWLVVRMDPLFSMFIRIQKDFRNQIEGLKQGISETYKHASHSNVFYDILQSDLPPQEKSTPRLQDEAQLIIAAGVTTTGWALSVASFHIINIPALFDKLRAELLCAMPNPTSHLDWSELEQLPYLSACVREGIRLSYGVTARNPRLFSKPIQYKSWVIPPGTPISMNIVDVVHDEEVFPEPTTFDPERWLNHPRTKHGANLDQYFVNFGKGSRMCLGMHLAYAELYIALATIFRRFRFELYETDVSDVALTHDFFLPGPKLSSKGVRVIVTPDPI